MRAEGQMGSKGQRGGEEQTGGENGKRRTDRMGGTNWDERDTQNTEEKRVRKGKRRAQGKTQDGCKRREKGGREIGGRREKKRT